jgi:SAM-dependent MidA family methyltransferase
MIERLDAFMARANAAYYATHDPFADFTTSPEITQVFGEVLGLWAAVSWTLLGKPSPVLLVEAGPGRGTLMADALRAVSRVMPDFHAALSLHLIETSPRLRAQQAARLPDAVWHEGLDTVPDGPMLLLANEFLDALPIRQLVQRGQQWTERFVGPTGLVEQSVCGGFPGAIPVAGAFPAPVTDWRPESDRYPADVNPADVNPADLKPADRNPADRNPADLNPADLNPAAAIYEVCEPARAFVRDAAARLAAHPGAALFLDYGPEQSTLGDSLQAIANGRPADPLSRPGSADLTAHVDFAALAAIARQAGAKVHGPMPQGPFLVGLGLFQRSFRLARSQPPARASALVQAAQRLAEPDRMGRLFKAMALCHADCPTLPGFAA